MMRGLAVLLFLVVLGCGGRGEVVPLPVGAAARSVEGQTDPGEVLVVSFQDARSEKGWVGSRTHLWGGLTHFTLAGGTPGERVASALADYLRQHGRRAAVASRLEGERTPQAVVTGEIQELRVSAKSRVGSTHMTAAVGLALRVANPDGTSGRFTVNSARTASVLWFDPQDLDALLTRVLHESFAKLLADNGLGQPPGGP